MTDGFRGGRGGRYGRASTFHDAPTVAVPNTCRPDRDADHDPDCADPYTCGTLREYVPISVIPPEEPWLIDTDFEAECEPDRVNVFEESLTE